MPMNSKTLISTFLLAVASSVSAMATPVKIPATAKAAAPVCTVHVTNVTKEEVAILRSKGYSVKSINQISLTFIGALDKIPNFGAPNEYVIFRSWYPRKAIAIGYKILRDRWYGIEQVRSENIDKNFPVCAKAKELSWNAHTNVSYVEPARNRLTAFATKRQAYAGLGESILKREHNLFRKSLTKAQMQEDFRLYNQAVEIARAAWRVESYDMVENVDRLRKALFPYIKFYSATAPERRYLRSALRNMRTSCESRTLFFIAVINDAGIDLGESYRLGVERFSDHVEPVIYSQKNREFFQLVAGANLEQNQSDIFEPEYLSWTYLNSVGKASEGELTFLRGPRKPLIAEGFFSLSRLLGDGDGSGGGKGGGSSGGSGNGANRSSGDGESGGDVIQLTAADLNKEAKGQRPRFLPSAADLGNLMSYSAAETEFEGEAPEFSISLFSPLRKKSSADTRKNKAVENSATARKLISVRYDSAFQKAFLKASGIYLLERPV
ncbi:MAG: hypothetical protein V4692_02715, partial [Bdellovibrionota bacterium]